MFLFIVSVTVKIQLVNQNLPLPEGIHQTHATGNRENRGPGQACDYFLRSGLIIARVDRKPFSVPRIWIICDTDELSLERTFERGLARRRNINHMAANLIGFDDAGLEPRRAVSSQKLEIANLPPPLKWAGGKRWLLPYLLPIWSRHKHRRLVEPFCGGLAVALGLMPERALLNDINPHLINFYRHVKRGLKINITVENDKVIFYANRDRFNELIRAGEYHGEESAALFYYLNRSCFNGLCRFNRSGLFNVPFGSYKTIKYASDFYAYQRVFKNWRFSTRDFENLKIEPGDLIYADPPYDVEFTTYSAGGFTWESQTRLIEWLADQRVPVILSNQATNRIVALYTKYGFKLEYHAAPRRISCTGDRTAAPEVLATKGL